MGPVPSSTIASTNDLPLIYTIASLLISYVRLLLLPTTLINTTNFNTSPSFEVVADFAREGRLE